MLERDCTVNSPVTILRTDNPDATKTALTADLMIHICNSYEALTNIVNPQRGY